MSSSGAEAVTVWMREKRSLNVVLMDRKMPGEDGCGATRRIRKLELDSERGIPRVPIICISAGAQDEAQEALDSGR